MPVKVMRIEDAPVKIMRWDRGKTLRLVDEADIPTMMAMMGTEKLLQGQLDGALARIQELAAAGKLA